MPLSVGARLGTFEILSALGAGGMGEVYRARDTRLGRDVAIKVLPAGATIEPERIARFEQEARAAAALNHPNIVALYDIGSYTSQGETIASPYLVIELLEGATLREKLANGALPVRKALEYARQIATGLAAAHEKGIVHRDLKPENIFITADDRAKILDFGLAKLTEVDPAQLGATALPTTPRATLPGMVLGTVGYMAPEQVRGVAADYRADLFAFGAVLYEMLSGQRAFRGETPMDVMMAVAREDTPSLAAARPDVPASLVRLVERCLEKEPTARFQSTRDLAFALDTPSASSMVTTAGTSQAETRGSRSSSTLRWAWGAAGLVLGAGLAVTAATLRPAPARDVPPVMTFELPEGFSTFRVPRAAPAYSYYWSPSPDGRWLLGIDLVLDGRTRFVLYELSTGTLRPLDTTSGSVFVGSSAWSPDSRFVAYWDAGDGYVKRIAVENGAVSRIRQFRDVRGVAWGPAGIVVANADVGIGVLLAVPADGGEPKTLAKDIRGAFALPNGDFIVADNAQTELVVLDRDGRRSQTIPAGGDSVAYAAGYLFFLRQGKVVAHRYDIDSRALQGDPVAIADAPSGGAGSGVMASAAVITLVSDAPRAGGILEWVDRAGRRTPVPGELRASIGATMGMSQGRWLATSMVDPTSNSADIWTLQLDTGALARVFQSPTWDSHPRWSRDGQRLIFRSNISVKVAAVNSGSAPVTVAEGLAGLERLDDWSPDERYALVSTQTTENRFDILKLDLKDGGKPTPLVATQATESLARISPDGALFAYVSDVTGPPEVYVQPLAGGGQSTRVSRSGGTMPKWSANGSRVYFFSPDGWIMETPVAQRDGGISVGTPVRAAPASGLDFEPSADGERFLILGDTPRRSIAIVNWQSLLPKN